MVAPLKTERNLPIYFKYSRDLVAFLHQSAQFKTIFSNNRPVEKSSFSHFREPAHFEKFDNRPRQAVVALASHGDFGRTLNPKG